jgi:hypothetical protein
MTDFGSCQSGSNFVDISAAYAGSSLASISDTIYFATTCCPAGGQCYNQVAEFDGSPGFQPGADPSTRKPFTYDMCSTLPGGYNLCPWEQPFTDNMGTKWSMPRGFLDINNEAVGTSFGGMTGSDGTVTNCAIADRSLLYYDNGTPCVADLSCQRPPFGGTIVASVNFDSSCNVGGAVVNYHADIAIYYPHTSLDGNSIGQLFCQDSIKNLGYKPGVVTSTKCNTVIEMDGHGGDIILTSVAYPGFHDNMRVQLSSSKTTGDCTTERYSVTYHPTMDGQIF